MSNLGSRIGRQNHRPYRFRPLTGQSACQQPKAVKASASKRKGIPAKEAGDLYLNIRINVPPVESEADRAAWEKIGRTLCRETSIRERINYDSVLRCYPYFWRNRCSQPLPSRLAVELIAEDIISIDGAPEKAPSVVFILPASVAHNA